jgi:hypothetical protein
MTKSISFSVTNSRRRLAYPSSAKVKAPQSKVCTKIAPAISCGQSLRLQLELGPERLPRALVLDEQHPQRSSHLEAEPVDAGGEVKRGIRGQRRLALAALGEQDQQAEARKQVLALEQFTELLHPC